MPTNVDLKPCSDCGDAAVTCFLRQFESAILTEIAKNAEVGEEQPITMPIPDPKKVRVSMSFKYKDKSTKQVFECMEGTVFPPGTLTVTQSQVL